LTDAIGDKIKIIESGSIDLFFKKIPNVLYVQDCPINLLSINKIAQELNCDIIFTTKKLIFQDWNTKSVIGEGVLEKRFYYLKEETCNFMTKMEEKMGTLWHKRIGHPFDKILKCIFYFETLDYSNCEVCKLGNTQNYHSLYPNIRAKNLLN
jgi:hypothetical protein